MPNRRLTFHTPALDQADRTVLEWHNKYTPKNRSKSLVDWFNEWRAGYFGMLLRLEAAQHHHHHLFNWTLAQKGRFGGELHMSGMLFAFDSALECCVYMLNALGHAVDTSRFFDTADEDELKRISPANVTAADTIRGKKPAEGYADLFPRFTALWTRAAELIRIVMDTHDVSKHRSAVYESAMMRTDPPEGFFRSIGVDPNSRDATEFLPMESVDIWRYPKKPRHERGSHELKLEDVCDDFAKFIIVLCSAIYEDVFVIAAHPPRS